MEYKAFTLHPPLCDCRKQILRSAADATDYLFTFSRWFSSLFAQLIFVFSNQEVSKTKNINAQYIFNDYFIEVVLA